jgi:predicted MFS family arabinose efflux permease
MLLSTSYAVLLPVIPVIVETPGRTGIAGAVTAALLATTVVSEFLTPLLMARMSPRLLVIVGMLLVGVPCVVYFLPGVSLALIFAASALRGVGLGIAGVVLMSVAARHSAPQRPGAAMGLYGTAFTLPIFAGPPLGLYLLGAGLGGLAGAISAAAGLVGAVVGMRIHDDHAALPGISLRRLVPHWPVLQVLPALVIANMTFGALVSFLPIVLPVRGIISAATFLLVSGAARVAGRFLSGLVVDRLPPEVGLLMGAAAALAGLLPLPFSTQAAVIIPAAAVYGLGNGTVQTAGFVAMIKRRAASDVRIITGAWNTAVDIGGAGGAAILGALAAAIGLDIVLAALPAIAAFAVPASILLLRTARPAT